MNWLLLPTSLLATAGPSFSSHSHYFFVQDCFSFLCLGASRVISGFDYVIHHEELRGSWLARSLKGAQDRETSQRKVSRAKIDNWGLAPPIITIDRLRFGSRENGSTVDWAEHNNANIHTITILQSVHVIYIYMYSDQICSPCGTNVLA